MGLRQLADSPEKQGPRHVAPASTLLHGYCHKLTRNLWDAEDLAQETLLRGFHHLSCHHDPIKSARAYLLRDDEAEAGARRPQPSSELVDRFVALYNAQDQAGLVELVLANATISNVGIGIQYGEESLVGEKSWLVRSLHGHPDWPAAFRYESQRAEAAEVEGERVMLVYRTRNGDEALEGVSRFEEEDGHVARILSYSFSPETIRAVGGALGLPVRTGLYRYPTREPGVNW